MPQPHRPSAVDDTSVRDAPDQPDAVVPQFVMPGDEQRWHNSETVARDLLGPQGDESPDTVRAMAYEMYSDREQYPS